MPLNLAETGKIYTIHRIGGQENERHHLENLGLIPGQELRLISEFHGYYIVSVKDTRMCSFICHAGLYTRCSPLCLI